MWVMVRFKQLNQDFGAQFEERKGTKEYMEYNYNGKEELMR